MNYKALRFIY